MKDYYKILGIERSSDELTIRKAYRLSAVKYHPDKHLGDNSFVEKFHQINEAYQTLNDPKRKREYDELWDIEFKTTIKDSQGSSFTTSTTYKTDTEEEEKFHYNPYKPFYSSRDRFVQDTPQFPPKIDHWGNTLTDDIEFIQLPKKIGKIISGFSSLKKGDQPLKPLKAALNIIISTLIGLAIGLAIIFIFSVEDNLWRFIWIAVPTIGLGWLRSVGNTFKHYSTFIGVNGFAEFECENSRDNITKSAEVNFHDITDLFVRFEERRYNFNYQNTAYGFAWMNSKTGEVVYEANGLHYDKEGNPPKDQYANFWVNKEAERYWTVYLLDKMESDLNEKGFIEFNLFGTGGVVFKPYIRIGIGYISFLKDDQTFTYKFNEIKKIYTKGSDLYIEHLNFEKVLFFFKSGNADKIPLMNLCNRQFFFKSMEILLGYKFG